LTEDGGEVGNMFEQNLGASTRVVSKLIRREESDDEPSTFWLANPDNSFEGNVAAGSEASGYWMELRSEVRDRSVPGYDPTQVALRSFVGNVAHSNAVHGVALYPSVPHWPYRMLPTEQITNWLRLVNLRIFRNKDTGIFSRNSAYMQVVGGVFADNYVLNVKLANDPYNGFDASTEHSFARVYGASGLPREMGDGFCGGGRRDDSGPIGVSVAPQYMFADARFGSRVDGVQLYAFSPEETGCQWSRALAVDEKVVGGGGQLDVRTTFAVEPSQFAPNLTLKDKINLCTSGSTSKAQYPGSALRDVTGSIVPGGGYIIDSSSPLLGFLPSGACTTVPDACAVLCPGVCVRALEFRASSLVPADTVLRVTKHDGAGSGSTIDVPARYSHRVMAPSGSRPTDNRVEKYRYVFYARLPVDEAGASVSYTAEFVIDGVAPAWPRFAQRFIADEPNACSQTALDLTLTVPPALCDGNLLENGDFEACGGLYDCVSGWWLDQADLVSRSAGANHFLAHEGRTNKGQGPSQWLDTRCTPATAGKYVFEAKIKLYKPDGAGGADDADVPDCFVSGDDCAKAFFEITYDDGYVVDSREDYDTTATQQSFNLGDMTTFVNGAWNTIEGELELTDADVRGIAMQRLEIRAAQVGVVIALDDVVLTWVPAS
jgi:hypothetical protein